MSITLKDAALSHYDIMMAWVSQQKQSEFPDFHIMENALNMKWYGNDCPYCMVYGNTCGAQTLIVQLCGKCPLLEGGRCCNGLWAKMAYARTWKTWLKNAKLVRKYIEQHG